MFGVPEICEGAEFSETLTGILQEGKLAGVRLSTGKCFGAFGLLNGKGINRITSK